MRKPHVSADKDAVNESHEPTLSQQEVLEVFRTLYVTNPSTIVNNVEISKQGVQDILDQLIGAGWVERIARGQYRLVYDGIGYVVQTVHYEHESHHIGVPTLAVREDLANPSDREPVEEPIPVEWMADVPEAAGDAESDEDNEDDIEDMDEPTPAESELDRLLIEAGLGEKRSDADE